MPQIVPLKNHPKSLKMLARVWYLTHVARQRKVLSEVTHMPEKRKDFTNDFIKIDHESLGENWSKELKEVVKILEEPELVVKEEV